MKLLPQASEGRSSSGLSGSAWIEPAIILEVLAEAENHQDRSM